MTESERLLCEVWGRARYMIDEWTREEIENYLVSRNMIDDNGNRTKETK